MLSLLRERHKRAVNELVVNPGKFVRMVQEWRPGPAQTEQDAASFLHALLDLIHQVLNRSEEKERKIYAEKFSHYLTQPGGASLSKHHSNPQITGYSPIKSSPARRYDNPYDPESPNQSEGDLPVRA